MNENVNDEDIEDEDVEMEVDDEAELIFPYEVEGDQTPPPRDESSDSEPPNMESSDSESEDEEADITPGPTGGTTTQRPFAIRDFPRGMYELRESSATRDSSCVSGLEPWALRRDLETTRTRARLIEAEVGTNRTETALLDSKIKIGEKERNILDYDLGNVEKTLGNVMERLKILESGENATLKRKLDETETRLAWARMERDTAERSLHESTDDGRPRKKSKKSDRDDGPSEPWGPPSDSYLSDEPVVRSPVVLERWYWGPTEGAGVYVQMELRSLESVFRISDCREKDKVKFATATLQGRALTWWNRRTASMGIDAANGTPWAEVRSDDAESFVLEVMVEPEQVKVEQYNRGLSKNIRGDVTSLQPATIDHAVRMAYQLMGQIIQDKTDEVHEGEKRKGEGDRGGRGDNRRDYNNRQNQRRANAGAMTNAVSNDNEVCPKCKNKKHNGDCWKCGKCGKLGHKTAACRCPDKREVTCFNCNKKGHLKKDCPTLRRNGQDGNNRGAVYKLGAVDAQQDPKVVTGTFLLNNRYATALFDSGADKSFVSTNFSTLIDIKPVELDTSYEVELADGKVVSTNNVLIGCTLNLLNHSFPIDLMVIELGSFDIIIGMDWLSRYNAAILCGEKKVRIPLEGKTLVIEGDRNNSRLKIVSCIKAQKYIEKGCELFLAQVTEQESKEKRLEDVPVIRDFPEVFPDELPGLFATLGKLKFRIDSYSWCCNTVARAPYR
ncbi:putative reverse transcriptase domain-containing protein [Tanacetum coccineum]